MSGGRAPARKGARAERQVVRILCELGLPCARVPFSGAIGGACSGDMDIEAQVKARHEFRTLHAWLGSNELLILKADHQNPLMVMPVHLFAELATAAQRVRP
jgi:hypothetical protein